MVSWSNQLRSVLVDGLGFSTTTNEQDRKVTQMNQDAPTDWKDVQDLPVPKSESIACYMLPMLRKMKAGGGREEEHDCEEVRIQGAESSPKTESNEHDIEKNIQDVYSDHEYDSIVDVSHRGVGDKYDVIGQWYAHFVGQKLIRFVKVYDVTKVKLKRAFLLEKTIEKELDDQYFEEQQTNYYEFCHYISHSQDKLFEKSLRDYVMYRYRKTWIGLDKFEEVWNLQDEIKEQHDQMLLEMERKNKQIEQSESQELTENDSVPSLNKIKSKDKQSAITTTSKLTSLSTPTLTTLQKSTKDIKMSLDTLKLEKHSSVGFLSISRIEQGLETGHSRPVFKSKSTTCTTTATNTNTANTNILMSVPATNSVNSIHTRRVQDVTVDSDSQMNLEKGANRCKSTGSFRENPFHRLRKTNSRYSVDF